MFNARDHWLPRRGVEDAYNTLKTWTRREFTLVSGVALLALAVRFYYVNTAVVEHPLRGDTLQYFFYALNLIDHGTFSLAPPWIKPTPDSFRDPGYPVFLALMLEATGRSEAHYAWTLNVQAALSAATVVICTAIAKRWLRFPWMAFVGVTLALWPHTITLSGYLLSETLLGFLIAFGLWLTQLANESNRASLYVMAGLVLGLASLTNAMFSPVVIVFAVGCAMRDQRRRRLWALLLFSAALPLCGWALRGSLIDNGGAASDRLAMNFVQGSWPEYHAAWRASFDGDPAAVATLGRINAEYELVRRDPLAGLHAVMARFSEQPFRYLAWYLGKPVELWGWSIGIGIGDIYVFPTHNSPLSSTGPLKITTDIIFLLAPIILLLAAGGVLLLISHPRQYSPAAWLLVAACVLPSLSYALLQCDARYSTPYRGLEIILSAMAAQFILDFIRRRGKSTGHGSAT